MAMKETFRNFRKRIVSLFEKNTYNSKRRSRLGVGVQNLNPECPRVRGKQRSVRSVVLFNRRCVCCC